VTDPFRREEFGLTAAVLAALGLERCTGAGVVVAVVDSGVTDGHPHVGRLVRGVRLDEEEGGGIRVEEDRTDASGHGTACSGVIRAIAPRCSIASVKILDSSLLAPSGLLCRAIVWAAGECGADVINLSLGTRREDSVEPLRAACGTAMEAGAMIVAAATDTRGSDYPAAFPDVLGVAASPDDSLYAASDLPVTLFAPPYPRSIPGRPREENFRGPSFAAARISGLLALFREARPLLTAREAMDRLHRALPALPEFPSA
jgi:subtilisin family serine protease